MSKHLLLFLVISSLLISAPKTSPRTVSPSFDSSLCAPLPAPTGRIVTVNSVTSLVNAVNNASTGDTILIADGAYALNGTYLRIDTPGVTVRAQSGNREAVVLDGNYQTTEIFQIAASNVTITELTLREAQYHPIHVISEGTSHTLNTLIYNVHIIDPGQQAIKVNPATTGYYTDNGSIACSHIELTPTGRGQVWAINGSCYTGGIDMHQSRGWTIRDNLIEGFWCSAGLSEHAIHLWRGCRDTVIERNQLDDNARGVGLGMATDGTGRTYSDNPCPTAIGYVDDFGGVVRNNFISANDPGLLASNDGFDNGISFWNACNAQALHNTIFTANQAATFSAIEWRFPNTRAWITNNLANDTLRQRDGAVATVSGNIENAAASWFDNPSGGDLHLQETASQAIDKVSAPGNVLDDFDNQDRPIGAASDIGADEFKPPTPSRVGNLQVSQAVVSGGTVTLTLVWSAPIGAESQTLRYATNPIDETNWMTATLLADDLSGNAATYSVTLPISGGTLYFAQKGYNTEGGWSLLSNNGFWPTFETYLPLIRR